MNRKVRIRPGEEDLGSQELAELRMAENREAQKRIREKAKMNASHEIAPTVTSKLSFDDFDITVPFGESEKE